MSVDHPTIKQFKGKMQKGELTKLDVMGFDKWRHNEKKCQPGSDLKTAADELWAEFEQAGGQNSIAPPPRQDFSQGAQKPQQRGDWQGAGAPMTRGDTNNAGAADASILGQPFHNPYTFIPFPGKGWFDDPLRERRAPTPLTIDEIEDGRFTGVVDIQLRCLSPLLSCSPDPVNPEAGHKSYKALTIGEDVIVPASGVRGSLRNLMTIIAGGTLGHLDEGVWLVQGRDLQLGPRGRNSPPNTPENCFLARVVKPGGAERDGKLELGETKLMFFDEINAVAQRRNIRMDRPAPGSRTPQFWMDELGQSISANKDGKHCWEIKLSGRPIKPRGKREGLFKGNGNQIDVPAKLWSAYIGRNLHGDHPELKTGDLVWIEAQSINATAIERAEDIKSIQWARWGREGVSLLELTKKFHQEMVPDSMRDDGKVDETTNLFGHIPHVAHEGAAPAFAARVRPENLVFKDGVKQLDLGVKLAPLAPPHPGCAAFYSADANPDTVTNRHNLRHGGIRGFKAYRVSRERGGKAPWLFANQGVYGIDGKPLAPEQKVNKTCDLLKEGAEGTLRIACRSLSRRELSILLLACGVDWRLGGGKPLGLGHCRPVKIVVRDEEGSAVCQFDRQGDSPVNPPEEYASLVSDLLERRDLWAATTVPVGNLRYPRAAICNRNRIQLGGHVWFSRHASQRKSGDGKGLEVLWMDGELKTAAGNSNRAKAQTLPKLDPNDPQADVLYGYDLFQGEGYDWTRKERNNQTFHLKLEPFDSKTHATGNEKHSGFHGQNQGSRQEERNQARGGGNWHGGRR